MGEFQQLAMLCFGNFIYAYRIPFAIPIVGLAQGELGEWARKPAEIRDGFAERSQKLVDIELIPRDDTPLVGYISAGEVVAEDERCAFLRRTFPAAGGLPRADWQVYEESLSGAAIPGKVRHSGAMVPTTASDSRKPPSHSSPRTLVGSPRSFEGNADSTSQVREVPGAEPGYLSDLGPHGRLLRDLDAQEAGSSRTCSTS